MQNGESCTPSINIGAAEAFESEMIEYIKGQVKQWKHKGLKLHDILVWNISCFYIVLPSIPQISSYFADKLLGIVRDIVLHMKGLSRSDNDPSTSSGSPQLVGDLHRGDAALEFIKHVCAVLALDQSVQHDVLVILVLPICVGIT